MKPSVLILFWLGLVSLTQSKTLGPTPVLKNSVCDKGGFDECLKDVLKMDADGRYQAATIKIENELCVRAPERCFKYGLGYMNGSDYEEVLRWTVPTCKAKFLLACRVVDDLTRKMVAINKQRATYLKKTEPLIREIRMRIKSKKMDYDLFDPKWSLDIMDKEISSKRILGKRIHFPVNRCGVFMPSPRPEKWSSYIECKAESNRLTYRIVVDSNMATAWPRKLKHKLERSVWNQGTVVELRSNRAFDGLVIVTDSSD